MRLRRLTTSALAALVAVPAVMSVTAAPIQAATGPYSGSATAHLLHVNTAQAAPTGPGLTDIRLARSTSAVDSAGLAASTTAPVPAAAAGKRSYSRAANIDGSILAGNVALQGILTNAEQSAPPTNANPAIATRLGQTTVAPIITAGIARSVAHSRWGATDETCLDSGTPISTATSEVANASLILDQAQVGPAPSALVSITNSTGGAAFSNTNVGLVNVTGQENRGLRSQAIAQLDGITLFKGSATNELTINVIAPPTLTAIATGSAATSTVTYTAPVLQIVRAGVPVATLDPSSQNQNISLPSGTLQLRLGSLIKTISDTTATGDAMLLEVKLLDVAGTGTLADFKVAPLTATATVPVGGVECGGGGGPNPLNNLQIDASTPVVFKDGNFDYVITVPNIGDCELTNVKVVLTVTGPAGTTITSTTPTAKSVAGLVATWENLGPIAPGALITLKANIKVPSGATPGVNYTGTAAATGTCAGQPAAKTVTTILPSVGSPSSATCDLSASSIATSHREVRVGDFFNEYVRVTNLGRGTCGPITVTLPYPPSTTFVSCSDNCTANNSTRVVTWTIPSLGSGASKDLVATFKVSPGATGVLGTTVTIKSGNQTVTDRTDIPRVTNLNVLNNLTHRSRGVLPRTGADLPGLLGLSLVGSFLAMRALRRRSTS